LRVGTLVELVKEFFTSNIGQSLAIAAIIAIVTQLLTARGRLAWAVSHHYYYQLANPAGGAAIPVHTQEIWVQNVGRASIDNVEVTLNWKPQHLEIWSPRKYTEDQIANDRIVLTVPRLRGREFFRISMLESRQLPAGAQLPDVLAVNWSGGEGRRVAMAPQRIYPKAVNWLGVLLFLVGATAIGYGLLQVGIRIYNLAL